MPRDNVFQLSNIRIYEHHFCIKTALKILFLRSGTFLYQQCNGVPDAGTSQCGNEFRKMNLSRVDQITHGITFSHK